MEKLCAVCQVPSNGFHFGVEVCKACSSFFRRTVSMNITFQCWDDPPNNCELAKRAMNNSPVCKSCRYAKCLAVGMRKEMVQNQREGYGKRGERDSDNSLILISSPRSSRMNRFVLSFMETIVQSYAQLEGLRLYTHGATGGRIPKHVNYKETIAVYLKEYYLVGEWLTYCFPDFAAFPDDQKDILRRNFTAQFTVLEQAYLSCKNERCDIRYLPNGDYIDCAHPETYYYDPDGQQTMTPHEAVKMFASSFQNYRRNVILPLVRENADRFEFLALAGMVLFDADLENISEETAKTCRKCRERIQKEMLSYYKSTRDTEEATMRLANFVTIIPSLHRATRRFLEDIEMSFVMKAYSVDQRFYDNCLPKFGNV